MNLLKRVNSFLNNALKVPLHKGQRNIMENIKELDSNKIVWIDLEMTGLDVEKDSIMEVGCIITDGKLNVVAEGPNLIIHQSSEKLESMNDWCKSIHGKSGLTGACRESTLNVQTAEDLLLEFVKKHTVEKTSPLAGNSVYMDRIFLMKYMPRLNAHLHYRIIDVSTIKELLRHWNIDLYRKAPKKTFTHRGLQDIKESIEELRNEYNEAEGLRSMAF